MHGMRRLLKAIHIGLILLFALYAGVAVIGYFLKLISPSNALVRYWQPGAEVPVAAIALAVLLGILACSIGIVKNPPLGLVGLLSFAWLVCFTWFAWLSRDSPFRLQEMVGVDLTDATAVRRAEQVHLVQAGAVYIVIVFLSVLPILLLRRTRSGARSQT
jgi:hypothetical protein